MTLDILTNPTELSIDVLLHRYNVRALPPARLRRLVINVKRARARFPAHASAPTSLPRAAELEIETFAHGRRGQRRRRARRANVGDLSAE